MGKDKSKKKSKPEKDEKKGKKAKADSHPFPDVAPKKRDELPEPGTDVTVDPPKKDRKRIEALEVGVSHDLPHLEHLYRLKVLLAIEHDDDAKKKLKKAAEAEIALYRARGEAMMQKNMKAEKAEKKVAADEKAAPAEEVAAIEYEVDPEAQAALDEVKARVEAKRAARAAKGDMSANVSEEEIELQRANLANEKAKTIKGGKSKAAKAILEVDSPDMPTPPVIVSDEALDADIAEEAFEAKLAEQKARDALDPAPHNIDDVLVKNRRPYLVPPGVEWDGEDESVLKPYSRVTSWIDVLDDKSQLTDWKLRTELAGLAALDDLDPDAVDLLDDVRAAEAEAVKAMKKLDKADRKGELFIGEYAERVADIERAYKSALDAIAERALDQGGAFDKAQRGTHLHAVFEEYDAAYIEAKGKLTIDDWIADREGGMAEPFFVNGREVEPVDIADLRAYRAAVEELGIEFVDIERRVVNDAHGTTGTLDRSAFYKPKDATRRLKVVSDLKTGRIDYGAGKIAQQIAEYATGDYYDVKTGKRERTGFSKAVGLLIHSPAGEGRTTIYEVDLATGIRRTKLAIQVKEERAKATEAQAYRGKAPFYRVISDVSGQGLDKTEGARKKAKADK